MFKQNNIAIRLNTIFKNLIIDLLLHVLIIIEMKYLFALIISVIFISSCSTCIECKYSDKAGTFYPMQEYCGEKAQRDIIMKHCQDQADTLDGDCICK